MPKTKKQKVRFHKGDKRPGGENMNLKYTTNLIKRGKKVMWQVIENPTTSIIKECFFEEDAQALCDFQNKHQVWSVSGGVPSFLCLKFNKKQGWQSKIAVY